MTVMDGQAIRKDMLWRSLPVPHVRAFRFCSLPSVHCKPLRSAAANATFIQSRKRN